MQTQRQLGSEITYKEIKDTVRQRKPIEFTAQANQVNLDNQDIKDFIDQNQTVNFPPLLHKQEIFQALWQMQTTTDSQQWDYIVLLTYLNDGHITYDTLDNDWYLVTINF